MGRAAPDLQRFFEGLRGTIAASHQGFPALRRLLDNDLTPLLSRLGGNFQGHSPWLAEFNPILKVAQKYRHEVTAIPGEHRRCHELRSVSARGRREPRQGAANDEPAEPAEHGRLPAAAHHGASQSLLQARRLHQPEAAGFRVFANTPCSAGITGKLDPNSPNDPNFYNRFSGTTAEKKAQALDLFNRIKTYGFSGGLSTAGALQPACSKQGNFKSVGAFREFTPYLHVRREP